MIDVPPEKSRAIEYEASEWISQFSLPYDFEADSFESLRRIYDSRRWLRFDEGRQRERQTQREREMPYFALINQNNICSSSGCFGP
jgi:hypothetical protein